MREWFDKNLIKFLYSVAYTSSIILITLGITEVCFECALWGLAMLVSNISGINVFQKYKKILVIVFVIAIIVTIFFIVVELLGKKHLWELW